MQATRGTPLTPEPADTSGTSEGPSHRDRGPTGSARALFAVVAVLGLAADQITKVLAVSELGGGRRVDLIGDLLGLRLVRNPGAAFSTGTGFTEVFSVLAVVAAVVVVFYARRLGDLWWAGALGLILAGVLGNLTDRLLRAPGVMRGHVVDFLELPHWPIFNIADVCLNLGVGLVIIQTFRGIALSGRRVEETR